METTEGEEVNLLTMFLELVGWEVNDKEKEKKLFVERGTKNFIFFYKRFEP